MRPFLFTLAAAALLYAPGAFAEEEAAAPTAPAADPVADEAEAEVDTTKLGRRQTHWFATLGVRTSYIRSKGFDPYSENDALVQSSLGVGRTVWAHDELSILALAMWDAGPVTSEVRGEDTELRTHRITAGPELRYHLLPRLFAFARLMPGALRTAGELEEQSTGATFSAKSWQFALDGSIGAGFEVVGAADPEAPLPRGWVLADFGYSWATASNSSLSIEPDEGGAPARTQPIDFPDLAVRGMMWRVSVAATF